MKRIIYTIALLAMGCSAPKEYHFTENDITLIPKPVQLELQQGAFVFDKGTTFVVPDSLQGVAQLLTDKLHTAAGLTLKVQSAAMQKDYVRFEVDKQIAREGYSLTSNKEGVHIKASTKNGFIYAVETLRQLLPKEIESTKRVQADWVIPAVHIKDAPEYAWRGLMLDEARHFFGKDYVLKTLDRMAMLKLNVFQWHLIDNEGWRIEIKKYPKLTEVGAWRVNQEDKHWEERTPNAPDAVKADHSNAYGGYYTQEDIKEIVAYAAARGITIVPEVEMPAHSMSSIAAYPELSCHKRPIAVPSGSVWPNVDNYCAGQEETFTFLEDVMREVMALFPSKYIHVGGDEADRSEWEKCPKCQARMKTEGLKNTAELQTYFIKRMQQFLRANGRTLVGWDEILEGGMPSDVVVMNWRGIRNAQKAVAQGNPMVLTSDTYINRYQGLPQYEPEANGGHVTLNKVYHYNLEREKLTEEQHKHILGSQANLWAEFIATPEHSEYMLFPRLFAFAEVVWTPVEQKDWKDFVRRVKAQMQRLDVMGVKYATSMYQVVPTLEEKDGKVLLTLSSELPDADIRYAFDGTPIEQGQRYTAPIAMSGNTICKAAVFVEGKPNVVSKDTIVFHKAAGKPVQCEPEADKKYQGRGPHTLTNVVRGTKNFQDGQWLGWLFKDATITIDMQTPSEVSKVIVGAMRKHNDAIFLPTHISVAVSTDGKTFTTVADKEIPHTQKGASRLANFSLEFTPVQTRYIKVTVKNLGKNPNGGDAWLFLDEILVF